MNRCSKPRSAGDLVRKFWGDAASGKRRGAYPVHWLESSLVLRHCVNPRISGDPGVGWLEWVKRLFVPEEARAGFVLGCGGGSLERRAAALGICRHFSAVDLSPEAIRVAGALARREGWLDFHYQVADANTMSLPPESFDLILSDMSLHHILHLEHLLDQFRLALRPGGIAVLNEFAGPNRFQWTDLQLELATRAMRALPWRLRRNRDVARWKRLLKPWIRRAKRWNPERVARMDPSESVRSSEIPDQVSRRFEVMSRIGYGGTLLALILNNIVGNFRDVSEDIAILKDLAAEEDIRIREGKLTSDYVLIVARRSD